MNTAANQNYLGPYPLPDMYGANTMITKDKDEFSKWYTPVQGEFNFRIKCWRACPNMIFYIGPVLNLEICYCPPPVMKF